MDSLVRSFLMISLLASVALIQGCGGDDSPATTTRLAAQAPTGVSCGTLATTLMLSDTTIVSSQIEPAGPFAPPDDTPAIQNLPSFCRVVAQSSPAINFEVWLPLSGWNQRFQGVGNGGLAGSISYPGLAAALLENYAAVSTDGGHLATNPAFLTNDQQVIDLGSRAVHLMTVSGEAIAQAFYGAAARYSYFNGCSTGGGQGMMESQRYPNDYNGIVVGAPQWHRTHLAATHAWNWDAAHVTAASNLSAQTLTLIGNAVLAKCDTLDGVKDGVIENPAICHWSPMELACQSGQDPSACLSPGQVTAAQKLYAGPTDPVTGAEIFPGYAPGVEFGWTNEVGPKPFAAASTVIVYGLENGNSNYDFLTFDFHRDVAALDAKFSDAWTAGDPAIYDYTNHGGKLLVYQGYADWGISYLDTLEYYNTLLTAYAGGTAGESAANVGDFWRMFFVPGMGHCSGGPGTDTFDPMPPLVDWVENNNAPTRIKAAHRTNGVVDKTRPLCVYPSVAIYKGSGDTNDAASFSCGAQPAT
jgi:feruloyl esterase